MAEWDTLLQDHRVVILDRQVAERLAAHLDRVMYAQAHPFRRPEGAENRRANQYGGKGVVKFQPTVIDTTNKIQQQITLVDWTSDDGYPKHVTVEISRIAAGGGGSFPAGRDASGNWLSYRPNAQVIITTPGASIEAILVDVTRGQRITMTASSVYVTVQMGAPPTFAAGSNPLVGPYLSGSLAVAATLGEGISPTLAPIVFTQYIDVPRPGDSGAPILTPIIIPEKANFLLPIAPSDPNAIISVDIFDNAVNRIQSIPNFSSGAMVAPLPLSDDAYAMIVTNNASYANIRLVYQISI